MTELSDKTCEANAPVAKLTVAFVFGIIRHTYRLPEMHPSGREAVGAIYASNRVKIHPAAAHE